MLSNEASARALAVDAYFTELARGEQPTRSKKPTRDLVDELMLYEWPDVS